MNWLIQIFTRCVEIIKPKTELSELKLKALEENNKEIAIFLEKGLSESQMDKLQLFLLTTKGTLEETIIWLQKFLFVLTDEARQKRIKFLYNIRYEIAKLNEKEYEEFDNYLEELDRNFSIEANEELKRKVQIIQIMSALGPLNDSSLDDDDKTIH